MAVPTSHLPVCRFAGLLAGSEEQLAAARHELAQWYGAIDDTSEILPFTFTAYYDDEMGTNLLRQWVRFRALFSPEHLAKCKLETNMAETLLARQFREKSAGAAPVTGLVPAGAHAPSAAPGLPSPPPPGGAGGGVVRPVNIDPGYIHRYKIILASTKDHAHRVYLTEGIYAEVTLYWHQNRWTAWPWTYADYQSETAQQFFQKARANYLAELQRITAGK